ncbi:MULTISPECIES: diguanylate cyclase [Paenibacillus]|uniref:GGDEF domain-containing protein n=1 Tax=Paenibacillus TaxID=44249 RepID=UPI002FE0FF0F
MSLLAEFVVLYLKLRVEPEQADIFLVDSMVIPSLIQLVVLGVNEAAFRYGKEWPLLIIASGTCIACALFIANKTVHLQYIFLLSLLVSMYYFNIRRLYLAFALNMIAFGTVYALYREIRDSMVTYELLAFFALMIGMLYIARGIIARGEQLLGEHTRVLRSEQELFVKNVLMDRMVKIDALTDLYNHKTLYEYLDQLIEQSNNCGMPMQLAVIDIDDFKAVNDTFGHAVGDVILARVADELKAAFSSNEIIARYGGEEFVVIFTGKTIAEAYAETEHARENIWRLTHAEMNGRQISVSIGLAEYRAGDSRTALFEEADSFLYKAKRAGKNRTVLHAPEESA